jgi:3-hydroxybutyryl-CoA dehydrogenase
MRNHHTAVLGAGVIGASWTALFLAAGKSVAVYDLSPTVEKSVRDYVEHAWPTLEQLGLTQNGNKDAMSFHHTATDAVAGAKFIQESVPERLPIKHELYQQIESILEPECVVASSASGLTLSEMQVGWSNPRRFVLGHPFNPPHLIPLVEVMGNDKTDSEAVDLAEQFYQSIGKVTIRVNKERPGHVANRLQAAVWREAIHLVKEGVASVEDVDKAMWAGPGLRWAAMGPNMLFHLGAGAGGMAEFCERYTDSFNHWWDDLGTIHLDKAGAQMIVDGVLAEAGDESTEVLSQQRDELIVAMLKATQQFRDQGRNHGKES